MRKEHGTVRSYVTGFVLSLVFTLIPYFLVVNQTVKGTMLLGTIVGFALLQMLVQVLFFLHLGRERNPRWQAGFLVSTVGAIFVVTVGTTWIMYHLHTNMTPTAEALKTIEDEGIPQVGGEKTGACEGAYVIHHVTIKDGVARPSHIDARRCDRLTFTNEDDKMRYIAFGHHDHHEVYGGEEILILHKGRGETLVLNELGAHLFHDHLHEETGGDFTVTP
jgi:cytochrome o ubiquinol oxidase operon protein cyoD